MGTGQENYMRELINVNLERVDGKEGMGRFGGGVRLNQIRRALIGKICEGQWPRSWQNF